MKIIIIILIMILPTLCFSHEGHAKAPGSFKSLHGGSVLVGTELNLEVIILSKEIIIFPTSHEGKSVPSDKVKIKSTAKPKKGKQYPISLTERNGGFAATIDLKGDNRLPIQIDITSNGTTDHFMIQVEE